MPQYLGSTTPLGSNATYTSPWILADNCPSLTGSVFANQSGTLNVDQSPDGVNADITDSTAITASTGTKFSVNINLTYVRLRYVNGASAQATLRLASHWTPRPGT